MSMAMPSVTVKQETVDSSTKLYSLEPEVLPVVKKEEEEREEGMEEVKKEEEEEDMIMQSGPLNSSSTLIDGQVEEETTPIVVKQGDEKEEKEIIPQVETNNPNTTVTTEVDNDISTIPAETPSATTTDGNVDTTVVTAGVVMETEQLNLSPIDVQLQLPTLPVD